MTNTQLISHLTQLLGCKEEDTRQYVAAIVKWLSENIVEKGQLLIADFGRFDVVNHKEYIAADSGGRTRMLMPPRLTLHFTPSPLIHAEGNVEEGKVFPALKEMLVSQCKAQLNLAEKLPVAFFKAILDGMDQGDAVEVDQLGEFLLTKVRVGDAIYGKVAFKPHETLAAWVNRPFSYFEPVELRTGVSFDDIETVFPSSPQPEESDEDVFLIYKEQQETEEPEESDEMGSQPVEDKTDEVSTDEETETGKAAAFAEVKELESDSEEQQENTSVEPIEETTRSHKKIWIWAAAAAVCLAGLLLFFKGNKPSGTEDQETAVVAKDTTSVVAETPAEKADTIDYAAMNAEIPYGAYDIVGVDTVITVMKGQSLADISRIFLGTDIQIYLTVLNGGNNEPKEGDHYKIPRLRLRK